MCTWQVLAIPADADECPRDGECTLVVYRDTEAHLDEEDEGRGDDDGWADEDQDQDQDRDNGLRLPLNYKRVSVLVDSEAAV